jgi:hypothetical protein
MGKALLFSAFKIWRNKKKKSEANVHFTALEFGYESRVQQMLRH